MDFFPENNPFKFCRFRTRVDFVNLSCRTHNQATRNYPHFTHFLTQNFFCYTDQFPLHTQTLYFNHLQTCYSSIILYSFPDQSNQLVGSTKDLVCVMNSKRPLELDPISLVSEYYIFEVSRSSHNPDSHEYYYIQAGGYHICYLFGHFGTSRISIILYLEDNNLI